MKWTRRECQICRGDGVIPTCELGGRASQDVYGVEPCFGCDGDGTVPELVVASKEEAA